MLNKTCAVERVWEVKDTWSLAPASWWLAGNVYSPEWEVVGLVWEPGEPGKGLGEGVDLPLGGEYVGMGAVRWKPSRGVILGD